MRKSFVFTTNLDAQTNTLFYNLETFGDNLSQSEAHAVSVANFS